MKINIYGMGYVGAVSAACLATSGHEVTGIDVDRTKVDMINSGKSPIVEPGLSDLLQSAARAGKLSATADNPPQADISVVCVGTPSNENGSLNYTHVLKVAEQIGDFLRAWSSYHVVNIRSTVLPGTVEKMIVPILEEHSGKRAGADFGVAMNPEFMREGSSIEDYRNPAFTLIGEFDQRSGDRVELMYGELIAPVIRTKIKVAEMLKYACNAFHAMKVAFANEIGNICKKMNIDSHKVMDILCKDKKLNISPYYLKPGFAFGGSCLPKDLRAIAYKAKEMDLETPVLSSILKSNRKQIDVAFDLVRRNGAKKVGFLGLSFKPDTDDLRESPVVDLVERLIGKGYSVSIFDKEVAMAKIFGANKKYIETVIPHVGTLMKDSADEVVADSEVVVVGNNCDDHRDALRRANGNNRYIVDLVRIAESDKDFDCGYEGICW